MKTYKAYGLRDDGKSWEIRVAANHLRTAWNTVTDYISRLPEDHQGVEIQGLIKIDEVKIDEVKIEAGQIVNQENI